MTRRDLVPTVSGAETEAFGRWRRLLCYLSRAGAASSIKRQYRRRCRHQARRHLSEDM